MFNYKWQQLWGGGGVYMGNTIGKQSSETADGNPNI